MTDTDYWPDKYYDFIMHENGKNEMWAEFYGNNGIL